MASKEVWLKKQIGGGDLDLYSTLIKDHPESGISNKKRDASVVGASSVRQDYITLG